MAYDFTPKSIWNIDDDRLKILSFYMAICDECFINWDLEGLYTYLFAIRRVATPKLKKDKAKWERLETKFKQFENVRRDMYNHQEDVKKKIEFYKEANDIYEELGVQMQEHGIFFREGLDPGRAALRR